MHINKIFDDQYVCMKCGQSFTKLQVQKLKLLAYYLNKSITNKLTNILSDEDIEKLMNGIHSTEYNSHPNVHISHLFIVRGKEERLNFTLTDIRESNCDKDIEIIKKSPLYKNDECYEVNYPKLKNLGDENSEYKGTIYYD